MAAPPSEFDLEGRRFELKRLSTDDACMGFQLIGQALGPAAVALLGGDKPDYGLLLQALLVQASKASELLRLFAPRARFDRAGNGTLVDLKPFVGEVFEGRMDLLLAFLIHAVRAEYASFLDGANALGPLLAQLGSNSPSPTAPTD